MPIDSHALCVDPLRFKFQEINIVAKKKPKKKQTGPLAKQKATVYTMMLIFSFLALVLACILMYLELKEYDFDIEAKQYQSAYLNPTVATDAETVASF